MKVRKIEREQKHTATPGWSSPCTRFRSSNLSVFAHTPKKRVQRKQCKLMNGQPSRTLTDTNDFNFLLSTCPSKHFLPLIPLRVYNFHLTSYLVISPHRLPPSYRETRVRKMNESTLPAFVDTRAPTRPESCPCPLRDWTYSSASIGAAA